jgi:hypothetical protein
LGLIRYQKWLCTLALLGLGSVTPAKSQTNDIDLQGYRGARTVLPENTLAGLNTRSTLV